MSESPVPTPAETHDRYDGRVLGTRAAQTRATILRALEEELRTTPWWYVAVKDVAGWVGFAPATFYCYFPDLEHAFDAMYEVVAARGEPIDGHVSLIRALIDYERGKRRGARTAARLFLREVS